MSPQKNAIEILQICAMNGYLKEIPCWPLIFKDLSESPWMRAMLLINVSEGLADFPARVLRLMERIMVHPRSKDIVPCILNILRLPQYAHLIAEIAKLETKGFDLDECALIFAAFKGNVPVVRRLLEDKNRVHADCQNGEALFTAAREGHTGVVETLLTWPCHAPHADCNDGKALVEAAREGREDVVKTLLTWPEHAPRADCKDGKALVEAAREGHEGVVKTLLTWPEHAPRADCQDSKPLTEAIQCGHEGVARMLLDAGADAGVDGFYLLKIAASIGSVGIVRLLMEQQVRPSDQQLHVAISIAIYIGNTDVERELRQHQQ